MRYCRHCGAQMDDLAAICVECGVPVSTSPVGEKAYCWHCGAKMDSVSAFCTTCGVAQADNANGAGANGKQGETKSKKLYRVKENKMLAGVCSGLAQYTGTNPWVWRLLFIIFGFSLLGILVYIGLTVALDYED